MVDGILTNPISGFIDLKIIVGLDVDDSLNIAVVTDSGDDIGSTVVKTDFCDDFAPSCVDIILVSSGTFA